MERFESVFDTATELEKDFDVTIEAEEDDDILAVVQGLKEDGTENFDDLHHTDEVDGKDTKFEDELGPDHDTKNKPTDDSNGEFDINDPDIDLACPNHGVEDAGSAKSVDPENLEDASDKATDHMEKSYDEAYNSLKEEFGLDEDDLGLDEDSDQQDQLENNEDHEPDVKEPVKQEGSEDVSGENKEEPTPAKEESAASAELTDEIEEDIPDDEPSAEEGEEITTDPVEESAGGDLTDEIEEDIIDTVNNEDEGVASDASVKALEDVDDDDIIDSILGEN